jgi:hypothetical protein
MAAAAQIRPADSVELIPRPVLRRDPRNYPMLKNYFGGYWPWRIAASLKSDSFDSALLAFDSSKTAFSFKHFYPSTDGPQPD